MKLVLNLYGFLKMNKCEAVPYPEPQLINAGSLNITKPKLFFKHITQPLLHTFTKEYLSTLVFDTKQDISDIYKVLKDKHEEPTIQIDCQIYNRCQPQNH